MLITLINFGQVASWDENLAYIHSSEIKRFVGFRLLKVEENQFKIEKNVMLITLINFGQVAS